MPTTNGGAISWINFGSKMEQQGFTPYEVEKLVNSVLSVTNGHGTKSKLPYTRSYLTAAKSGPKTATKNSRATRRPCPIDGLMVNVHGFGPHMLAHKNKGEAIQNSNGEWIKV